MLTKFVQLLESEDGAVSADMVLLMAGVVALAVAVGEIMATGSVNTAADLSTEMEAIPTQSIFKVVVD